MRNKEIEVRFLGIDKEDIKSHLAACNAQDLGESKLREVIFYDQNLHWRDEHKYIRVRDNGSKVTISYKQHHPDSPISDAVENVDEINITTNNFEQAIDLFQAIGLKAYRKQEKYRHSFLIGTTQIELDTWPSIPTYIEIEGESEEILKETAALLNLQWKDAYFGSARHAIEHVYKIPVSEYTHFTFERMG